MKRRLSLILVLSLVLSLALTGCGGGSKESDEIKIGSVFPTTGQIATFGISSVEAVELAFEEINANGGILGGKKLKLYNEDNQSKAEETATAFTKLIDQEKVVAILGSVASSHSLAGAPIAQAAGVPMVSPTSTNPAVTEVGDFIFRACFIDPFQGQVMAQFAKNDLKASKAALIVEQDSDYAKGLAEFFKQSFTKSGGTIVAEETFTTQDKDFSAILTRVKAAAPDVVFIPSYYDTVGPILKQAQSADLEAVFLGGDGWDSPDLFELAGDAANGNFFSNHYSPDAGTPEIDKFIAAYNKKYNKTPDALAALAYDAAYLLVQAIEKAGSTDGAKVRDALAGISFKGVSGAVTFDAKRNPIKSAVIIAIENGKQVYKTTVNP